MSGYVLVTSACVSCHQLFSYNPHRVPSIRVEGVREPVCQHCMARLNAHREAHGLDRFPVHPQAYKPLPEGEL